MKTQASTQSLPHRPIFLKQGWSNYGFWIGNLTEEKVDPVGVSRGETKGKSNPKRGDERPSQLDQLPPTGSKKLKGSGKAGRVTRDDVLAYGSQKEAKKTTGVMSESPITIRTSRRFEECVPISKTYIPSPSFREKKTPINRVWVFYLV